MFKNILLSNLVMLAVLTANAQNSEPRTLPSFSGIEIQSKAKVSIYPGSSQAVTVSTKGDLKEVLTTVEEGVLNINGRPSEIEIIIPSLNSIHINGMGEVTVDSVFNSSTFNIEISGNGKVILPIETDAIKAEISGYGKIKLEGNAKKLDLIISGNGKVDAEELTTMDASVNISGIGKTLLDANNNLEVNVSGNAAVYYKKEPAHVIKQVSGVARMGLIDTEDDETTAIHSGKKRIVIVGGNEREDTKDIDINIDFDNDDNSHRKEKKSRSHWMGIDFGFNGYVDNDFSTGLPGRYNFLELNTGKSVAVNLNLFAHDFKIYKRYVMFTTGIGMSINNYRFNSDSTLIPKIDSVDVSNDTLNLSKNKLTVTYATLPLLLQFNTSANYKRSFHIGTGVLLSYRIESHTKRVYSLDGDKKKDKTHDDFNINPFRAEATLRIGYRGYTLFGNYAFTELFNSGHGPVLHPFTIGLSLSNW